MSVSVSRWAAGGFVLTVLAILVVMEGGEIAMATGEKKSNQPKLPDKAYASILSPQVGTTVPLTSAGKICVQVEAYDGPIMNIKYPTEVRVKIFGVMPTGAMVTTLATDARNAAPKMTASKSWVSFIELDPPSAATMSGPYWVVAWVQYATTPGTWYPVGPNSFNTMTVTSPPKCDDVDKKK